MKNLIKNYNHSHKIIFSGDFNGDIGRNNINDRLLKQWIKDENMTIMDLNYHQRVQRTFLNTQGHESYVDHVIVNNRPWPEIVNVKILVSKYNLGHEITKHWPRRRGK
jgi:hypothetical protein